MTDYQAMMAEQDRHANWRDIDSDFWPLYRLCAPFTMTSIERLHALYKSVEYVGHNNVLGDFAEFGVWRGGSLMMMGLAARKFNLKRNIFGFDTFEGHLVAPDNIVDVDIFGGNGLVEFETQKSQGNIGNWCAASIEEVSKNLSATGIQDFWLVAGLVEERDLSCVPALSILRLDMDWYKPTVKVLEAVYPKLTNGGVLIADDYGHYIGQRKAVDEFLETQDKKPMLHRIDYSCRVGVKS